MHVTYTHAAGLDVHKKTVVACIFTPGPKGTPHKQIRTFGTMTQDLLALVDWLTTHGITHVALERAPASFGSPSTTCWKGASPSWWPTPTISRPCPGAKRM